MSGILQAFAYGRAFTSAPVNTVAPVVSGTTTFGQTLSCTTGTWTGIPTPTYTYQWFRSPSTSISGATSSTYVLVQADVGSTIYCRVTATNSVSAVNANSNTTATVAATVPGAPTIGTATAVTSTSATVSYTAPASNGGATITTYTATSSPGGYTGSLATAGSGTITVSGLSAGTAYTFTVKATNSVGQSAASAASNSVTPVAPGYILYMGERYLGANSDGQFRANYGWGFTADGYLTTNIVAASSGTPYVGAQIFNATTGARTVSYNITNVNPPSNILLFTGNGSYSQMLAMANNDITWNTLSGTGSYSSWNFGNTWRSVSTNSGGGGWNYQSLIGIAENCWCVDSSGNVLVLGNVTSKGTNPRRTITKFSSNGATSSVGTTGSSAYLNYTNSIFPRSDGTYLVCGLIGSANNGASYVFANNLATCTEYVMTPNDYGPTSFNRTTCFDRTNNIYWMVGSYGSGVTVGRWNASHTNTVLKQYTNSAYNSPSQLAIEYYNGYVYVMVDSNNQTISIYKLDATTLAVVNSTSISSQPLSTRNLNTQGMRNLAVNANGIFFAFTMSGYDTAYYVRLPVNSTLSNQDITIPTTSTSQTLRVTNTTASISSFDWLTFSTAAGGSISCGTSGSFSSTSYITSVSSISNSYPATSTNFS